MEHPSAVILHLGLDEVEVPGLVVCNAHVQLARHHTVCGLGMRPGDQKCQWVWLGWGITDTTLRETLNILETIHLILDILSMTEISFTNG